MTNTPLTWLADELRAWRLDVVEVAGWQTRTTHSGDGSPQNPYAAQPFIENRGVLLHDTVDHVTATVEFESLGWVLSDSEFPGPKYQLLVGRPIYGGHCRIAVVAAGRANHAGLGGPFPNVPQDNANSYLVAISYENNGVDEPFTPEMLRVGRTAAAAVLHHGGLGVDSAWFHKTWAPTRKVDPHGQDLATERAAIAQVLNAGKPGTSPTVKPKGIEMLQFQLSDQGMKGFIHVDGKSVGITTAAEYLANKAQGVPSFVFTFAQAQRYGLL